jgi:hypothetical protein
VIGERRSESSNEADLTFVNGAVFMVDGPRVRELTEDGERIRDSPSPQPGRFCR